MVQHKRKADGSVDERSNTEIHAAQEDQEYSSLKRYKTQGSTSNVNMMEDDVASVKKKLMDLLAEGDNAILIVEAHEREQNTLLTKQQYLADEIFIEIFGFLDFWTIIKGIRGTCKRFRDLSMSYFCTFDPKNLGLDLDDNLLKNITTEILSKYDKGPITVYLEDQRKLTSDGIKPLTLLTNISELSLLGCKHLTDHALQYLAHMTSLEMLDLSYIKNLSSQAVIDLVTLLPRLRRFGLNGNSTRITDDVLVALEKHTDLEYIGLEDCPLTDTALKHITMLTKLSMIDISSINDTDLSYLSYLPNLTEIDFAGSDRFTDAGLAHLRSLTKLQEIDIHNCDQLNDDMLANFSTLTELTCLNIGDCYNITSAGLAHLQNLTKMETLIMYNCCRIDDNAFVHLSKMTALSKIDARGTKITYEGLKHLKPLTQLSKLNVAHRFVGKRGEEDNAVDTPDMAVRQSANGIPRDEALLQSDEFGFLKSINRIVFRDEVDSSDDDPDDYDSVDSSDDDEDDDG
eukprot:GEZU01024213.1.p1 GENE.GEZU01024213.1~~GEZU01024213.1.p1  ORF type:complete len:553 (+),score=131.78 GEZU01024213.1:117-1661(+)